MSRRKTIHDPGFGSDSFLDVLANIVGILIILIVIAGVRIGQAPILSFLPAQPEAVTAEPAASTTEEVALPLDLDDQKNEQQRADEFDREMSALVAQTRALDAELAASAARLSQLENDAKSADLELLAERQSAQALGHQLKENKLRLARLEQSLGERKQSLTSLLAEFEEVRSAAPPAVEIRHRLAPISQDVVGEEVHFRLEGNRVSVIPLTELVERVKKQLERQKDWLARRGRHQGTVGPVDGYSLQFILERQSLSPLEEHRLGSGAFRVGVSHWHLIPEKDASVETAEQALRRGSRFALALQTAPDNAALTFWVYPDSFELFRTLQAAAHAEGFVVCGRPLPAGMPIAGSPHGTRSAGQ